MIQPLTQYAPLSLMTANQMTKLTKKKSNRAKKSTTSLFPEAYSVEISERGRALAAANSNGTIFIIG
jgi:hypothetical protein